MRSIGQRPTAMERWPDGWREGMRLATGPQDRDADGFYQKRLPRGAPDFVETVRITFPSGRTADELCPTEPAVAGLGRADGCGDLPPLAGASGPTSTTRTSCASTSTRSPAPRSPTRSGSPTSPASCSRSSGCAGTQDQRQQGHPRLRADPAAVDLRRGPARGDRARSRARAPRRGRDDGVVEGGARHPPVPRLQPEPARPDHRQRVEHPRPPGCAGQHADVVGRPRAGRGPPWLPPAVGAGVPVRGRPVGGDGRRGVLDRAAPGAVGVAARRRAELAARLPQAARRAAAGAAEQEGGQPLGRRRQPHRDARETTRGPAAS